MRTHEEGGPADLEERGWQALATEGAGAEFYREVLDDTVVMLLPGGLVLDDRAAIIGAMGGPPWSRYRLGRLTEHTRQRTPRSSPTRWRPGAGTVPSTRR